MAMELSVWSQYYHDKTPEWAVEEFLKDGITTSELSDEHGRMLLERDADAVFSFLRPCRGGIPR